MNMYNKIGEVCIHVKGVYGFKKNKKEQSDAPGNSPKKQEINPHEKTENERNGKNEQNA